MKKFILLYIVFFIPCLFYASFYVKAEDSCEAMVILHYHRFDDGYKDYELYTWGNKNDTPSSIISSTQDPFGVKFTIPVCESANDDLGIIIKHKDSWVKDGIDANLDGEIDNKYINVGDLKGTANKMDVYLVEGAADVYYRNPILDTYFAKPGFGNLVVVYYNPQGNQGWDDFWTWGTGTDAKAEDIAFDYQLGLNGGTEPNLFKVGIVNIAKDADDQIGLVIRKDRSWKFRNTNWAEELNSDITDENGNTYLKNGNILINVTNIKGSGFKFIFIVNGERQIFENFNAFKEKAFQLTISNAQFINKKELTIVLNKSSAFNASSIDVTNFHICNQAGEDIPIDYLSYDSSQADYNEIRIVLKDGIEKGNQYTIFYNYELFGQLKSIQADPFVEDSLFQAEPLSEPVHQPFNYTPYFISGGVIILATITGLIFIKRKK